MEKIVKLYLSKYNQDKEKAVRIKVDYFEWVPSGPRLIAEEYGSYWKWEKEGHWEWVSGSDESFCNYLQRLPCDDAFILKIKIEKILVMLPKDSRQIRELVTKCLSDFLEKLENKDVREAPQLKDLRTRLTQRN